MDSVTRYEFHRIFDRVSTDVDLKGARALQEWLGRQAVKAHRRGIQHTATVKYRHARFRIVDAQVLLKSFGFGRLGDCGRARASNSQKEGEKANISMPMLGK